MKVFTWRNAAVAVVLIAVSGQAAAWGGRGYGYGGRGGYYHGGYSHGYSRGAWIGGATALLATGAVLAWANSRPAYSTSVYYGPTYAPAYGGYYGPAVSYAAPVYVSPPVTYVAPPVQYVQPQVSYAPQYSTPQQESEQYASSANNVVAYPAGGQNSAQQARDGEACKAWAINHSGFDPSVVTQYTTSANTESYSRALGACYKGRGYSIN